MDRYSRLFILASLVYLSLGVALGALMGTGLLDRFAWRFVHFHVNLLGFMTMIVSGVAYHVLPRFTGRPVAHPRLIGAHFWLANLGLLGMIITRGLVAAGVGGAAMRAFPLFAVITALGAWLFAWNLFPLLLEKRVAGAGGRVTPQMRVSEILARWPASLPIFREWGFAALANPAARATFAKLVTLEKACRLHKVDQAQFLAALKAATGIDEIPLPVLEGGGAGDGPRPPALNAVARRSVGGEVKVGDLIREHPVTRDVLEKFFGPDCFSCPGQVQETLAQSASLHGVDPDTLLDAVNDALRGARKVAPDGMSR